jgi:hypothetical protein
MACAIESATAQGYFCNQAKLTGEAAWRDLNPFEIV